MPYQSESLSGNVAWSMVSKAADKQSTVRAVALPLSLLKGDHEALNGDDKALNSPGRS